MGSSLTALARRYRRLLPAAATTLALGTGSFYPLMTTVAAAPAPAAAIAYDAELTNFQYPREVRFLDLESQRQKLKMAYIVTEPQKPNGRTVLLLHGKNFAAFYWEPTIAHLLERGYRVVAPDQIGFGKSSKPEAYQFSFHGLAANTKALLDALKIERVDVVGHSMGGMLASRFALMYPAVVERLILVNPIGLEDWKTVVPYQGIDAAYANELKQTRASIREYQRQSYFDGAWKPEYEPLIEVLAGWTEHPEYKRVAWNAALTADMVFTQPVLYEFPKIKASTLLIIGTRDRTAIGKPLVSEAVRKTMGDYTKLGKTAAAAIPGARLVELPGVGHMPQIEAFDAYAKALVDFLAP